MASEVFTLFIQLLFREQGTSSKLSKVKSDLRGTEQGLKSAGTASRGLSSDLASVGKQNVAAAATVAALGKESKETARTISDAGKQNVTVTSSVASAELSLEQQRRASESLQRQRSSAFVSQQRAEERAAVKTAAEKERVTQRVAAEEQRATQKAKQAFSDVYALREAVKKDLVLGGIGVGTLYLMSKGVKVAGDFEQSMNGLKLSIAEVGKDGAPNLAKLNDQMARSQSLAVRLGNTLPGSTEDFVQMMTTLRQGGMQTERMLGGGGEAVAQLAVVTHSNPAELAKEYAQVGEMFQLSTQKEWTRAADVSARLFRATGIRPEEQVQGLKFAEIRAGSNLGLKGLEGYEGLGRILGTLRTFGLEGGFGGRELSRFLMQLASFEKNAAKLKKTEGIDLHAKGIDLKFFDDKGKFAGFDNIFKQLEKLRVLSDQERIKVGEKVFTAEGTAIATAFMTAGEEGWKKINDRVDAVLPLEQQIAQVTDTWNAKLENVEGTFKNLVATAFTPALNQLKPLADETNVLVGYMQELAAAHPGVASLVSDFVGVAGVSLTLAGGIRAGTTAWGLYTLATGAATRGLQGEAVAAAEASAATTAVNSRLLALKNMSAMKLTVTIAAAYVGFEVIEWLRGKTKEYEKEIADAKLSAGKISEERSAIRQGPPTMEAQRALSGKTQEEAIQRWKGFTFGGSETIPFLDSDRIGRWLGYTHAITRMPTEDLLQTPRGAERHARMIDELRQLGGGALLNDRPLLAALMGQAQRGNLPGVFSPKEQQSFQSTMKEAVGDQRFAEAMKLLATQTEETAKQEQKTNEAFKPVQDMLTIKFPGSLQTGATAVERFADRLNSITVNSTPGASPSPTPKAGGISYLVPSRRPAEFHPEVARAIVAEFRGQRSGSGSQKTVHVHPGAIQINLPAGSRAADDPREIARAVAHQLEIQMERA
jgi:hypothetical protein